MGDEGVIPRQCYMKALLGIVAGAGASYGIYKLVSSGNGGKQLKNPPYDDDDEIRERGRDGDGAERPVLQPGTLLAKVSGLTLVRGTASRPATTVSSDQSSGSLEAHHLEKLLSLLQSNPNPSDRIQVLITLGNAAAFCVNQDIVRELGGLHIIAGLLSDPLPDVRVQAVNALSNLSMNVKNQEQLKIYIPQVLELIEMSPVNSDLQLASLRLLTNLSVTDYHHHLMYNSVTLFLSLLVVSSETLQTQVLKVLVNLSSNPDMMEDIVQAQAPASLVLLFDRCTSGAVLVRLLTFVANLRTWRPSAHLAEALQRSRDSLYSVLLSDSSQLHHRLPQLLSHPDAEVRAQVARLLV